MNNELLTVRQTDHLLTVAEEQLKEMRTAIRERLEKTNKGGIANSIANCQLILRYDPVFKGKICRNELTGCTDIVGTMPWRREGTLLSDKDIPHILLYLERHYGITSEKKALHALEVIANENHFHPIRDYLNSLTWDGVPRVREALHHFLGADISDFNEQCLCVFMLGAINRVFHPGCKFELMLVLVGGQGAGKTTFVRFLAVKEDWFTDDIRKLDDENIYRHIMSHWIVEMSEMVATANAKSIEEIKSFLSRSKDTYKEPYDRFPADRPRQCVFAGTTNRMDFLPMDRTGNRRFLPVQVHPEQADIHILSDEAASRAYFDQLWQRSWCSTAPAISARISARTWSSSLCRSRRFFSRRTRWLGRSSASWRTIRAISSAPSRFIAKHWSIPMTSPRHGKRGKSVKS